MSNDIMIGVDLAKECFPTACHIDDQAVPVPQEAFAAELPRIMANRPL